MTDTELLNRIKGLLHETGTYQDDTLTDLINEVKCFMKDAGVDDKIINSPVSVGVIFRGVSDMWDYGAGTAKFSEYFVQRVMQLKYKTPEPAILPLTVTSTAGAEIGTTKITVQDEIENPLYRYKTQSTEIPLPAYNEDLSDWTYWNGISDIKAEDRHYICVAIVDSDNKAIYAGITRIVTRLV